MTSNVNKKLDSILNAFDKFKNNCKSYTSSLSKIFNRLSSWSTSESNVQIQDLSNKLGLLFENFEKRQNTELLNVVQDTFADFKQENKKLSELAKKLLKAKSKELKYMNALYKCNPSNVRDYEVKIYKARIEKEKLEIKYFNLWNEIETSKAILFKKNLNILYEALRKRNDAENIVVTAMKNMVSNMSDPDESNMNYVTNNDCTIITSLIFNDAVYQLNDLFTTNKPQLPSAPPFPL